MRETAARWLGNALREVARESAESERSGLAERRKKKRRGLLAAMGLS